MTKCKALPKWDKIDHAAQYLFWQYANTDAFTLSPEAHHIDKSFRQYLRKAKAEATFKKSIRQLEAYPLQQYQLASKWIDAYLVRSDQKNLTEYTPEAALLIVLDGKAKFDLSDASASTRLDGIRSIHPALKATLNYHKYIKKIQDYADNELPKYRVFQAQKQQLSQAYRDKLQLENLQPKVMSSFVRNQLISQVYLPIIGDNLAQQIGTAGEDNGNRQGLLMLLSPPGYGKTTLVEYIANRLGLHFIKINGPALSHRTYSLDPAEAPNQTAASELYRLNLSLAMGDNIMIYIDDIQHCHPEFLQKFISLCDAQRKIEGVWNGKSQTYDFRGQRVAVVMAGNPYTESGEQFKVPDMLANRADIYNLGDIIGNYKAAFELSYIENALLANKHLAETIGNNKKDAQQLIQLAEGLLTTDQLQLSNNYAHNAWEECVQIIKHLLSIRSVILKVNQRYIHSASIANEDRKEPAFLLQGSYRNMNKLAQKVIPIMSNEEVQTLLLSHYKAESQTLSSEAEVNFLFVKEIMGGLNKDEQVRLQEIRERF
ncbi:MAG: AAA family ATPase [Chitinophagales bacterium]|nr:AAA family ATPase [Chitinophagales bacterium]